MSRFGTGLQGAFLGLNAACLLTLLLGVWLRGWPLNPYFAGVALLGLGLQRLTWPLLLPSRRGCYRATALAVGLLVLLAWGLYGYL